MHKLNQSEILLKAATDMTGKNQLGSFILFAFSLFNLFFLAQMFVHLLWHLLISEIDLLHLCSGLHHL